MSRTNADRIFRCEVPAKSSLGRAVSREAAPALEWLLGFDRLNALYEHVTCGSPKDRLDSFLNATLEQLGVRCHVRSEDLARIPKTGPLIIVANHPFGAIEGILLASTIAKVRPEVQVVANYLLQQIPQLRRLFLYVDPFAGPDAAKRNIAPTRQAIRFVRDGGALAIFPAGEVSHFQLSKRQVADPPWSIAAAKLIRLSGAPVLPVYFGGSNGTLFQLLGMFHPRLRTAMLPREFLAMRNRRIDMRIGSTIPRRQLDEFGQDDAALINHLRQRTYLLQHRPTSRIKSAPATAPMQPVAAAGDRAEIRADVASLPDNQTLLECGDYRVAYARAPQIPSLLPEIGRLREIAFRATGEGTGSARDIDTFDYDYLHLFVWHKRLEEVVGGYRMGLTDVLLAAKGRQGLYTSTLFDYSDEALRRINPGLELGRSFVAPAHQRSYAALLLLWKGIGQFIVRNPKYTRVFGPVSISNSYQSVSKQLMIRFLRVHHGSPDSRRLITPRNPFRQRRVQGFDDATVRARLADENDVSAIVSEIEPDHKGIPVLLRQYLKFGAKLLAINVDPQFSNVVDGLLLADLTRTDPTILRRYMGIDGMRLVRADESAR